MEAHLGLLTPLYVSIGHVPILVCGGPLLQRNEEFSVKGHILCLRVGLQCVLNAFYTKETSVIRTHSVSQCRATVCTECILY